MVPALGVGWLAGVLGGSLAIMPDAVLVIGLVGVAIVYAAGWGSARIQLVSLAVLAGIFGIWRSNAALAVDQVQRTAWEPLYGQVRVVRGTVRDAQARGTYVRLTVGELEGPRGFLQTTVPRLPGLTEHSRVVLRGEILRPEELVPKAVHGDPAPGTSSRYGERLERVFARRQVFAAMVFPGVTVEEVGVPSRLTRIRLALRGVLLRNLPEPAAGLYSALLLSFDGDLPRDLRDRAAATGILHLLAISGSHLAVLAGAAFFVALALGLSRRAATVLTLGCTMGFLVLVGFPESGVRSGIMAGLVLTAYLLGRPASGLRALLIAAVAMTIENPRLLLGDVGFQLSTLAVWGLLVIFPMLQAVFQRVPNPWKLRSVLLLAVSAELATLPVVAYTFGRVPLVGPLTNVAAGVLFPALLGLGALVVIVGSLLPAAVPLFSPAAAFAGTAFLGVAEFGSRIPHHVLDLPLVPFSVFLSSVLVLLLVVHGLHALFPPVPARASRQ